jgi:hypothetical protein
MKVLERFVGFFNSDEAKKALEFSQEIDTGNLHFINFEFDNPDKISENNLSHNKPLSADMNLWLEALKPDGQKTLKPGMWVETDNSKPQD